MSRFALKFTRDVKRMKILVPSGRESSIFEDKVKRKIKKKIKTKNANVDLFLWPFAHLKYDFVKSWLRGLITKVKQKDILIDAFWSEFPDIINYIKYFTWDFNKFSLISERKLPELFALNQPSLSPESLFNRFVSEFSSEISQHRAELEVNLKDVRRRAHSIMFAKPRTYQRIDYATFLIAQAKKKIKRFEKRVQKQVKSVLGTLEPLEIVLAEYVLIPFFIIKTDMDIQIFNPFGKPDNFRTKIFRKVVNYEHT